MRVVLAVLLSAFSFLLPASAPIALSGSALSAHHIEFENKTDGDSCSATSVGPHTLLTAAHCMIGTDRVTVDGATHQILVTIYDGQDHELIVTDATFTHFLPIEQRPPAGNEHVRVFGFPGGRIDQVQRDGHFEDTDDDLFIFVLPTFPGDSGSGLISDGNTVIGVVSLGNKKAEAAAWLLMFTQAQLAQVK